MGQTKPGYRFVLKCRTPTCCFQQKLCEATLTSALLFKYRLKFLLPFGDTASVAAPVSTGVRLTRGGLTLGVRARNAAHIACLLNGSCKSATSSWVLVYRRISLLRFPPFSVLVSFFISLCLSCLIISLSSGAKNTSCH